MFLWSSQPSVSKPWQAVELPESRRAPLALARPCLAALGASAPQLLEAWAGAPTCPPLPKDGSAAFVPEGH